MAWSKKGIPHTLTVGQAEIEDGFEFPTNLATQIPNMIDTGVLTRIIKLSLIAAWFCGG